jgi:DNA replication protein DnaC
MNSMSQHTATLLEKMKKSGRYRPIDEDEYRELQRRANARLEQNEQQEHKPDLSRLGLVESELSMTWDLINPRLGEGMKVLNALRPKYNEGSGMVFLWGAYGQAKTLAGKVLVATAHRDGKRAAYANMSRVLDDIRLAFDNQEHKTTELIRRMGWWATREVLFIDEIDKVNETQWASERIFELVDRRYTTAIRKENLTVFASNKSDGALDGYLRSRLNDVRLGPVVELKGVDGRQYVDKAWEF